MKLTKLNQKRRKFLKYAALTPLGLFGVTHALKAEVIPDNSNVIPKGTSNESGIDLDLTVATMWGDWHTKPHYWGAGKFSGDRGTIAFWVKTNAINPGIVFIQGSISWGHLLSLPRWRKPT